MTIGVSCFWFVMCYLKEPVYFITLSSFLTKVRTLGVKPAAMTSAGIWMAVRGSFVLSVSTRSSPILCVISMP